MHDSKAEKPTDCVKEKGMFEPSSKATTQIADMSVAWNSYYKKVNLTKNFGEGNG